MTINAKNAECIDGKKRTDLGHLSGRRDEDQSSSTKEISYFIRITGANPSVTVTVESEKGGKIRRGISLKE